MSSIESIIAYDTKLDSKNRIKLKHVISDCYHVEEYDDGEIILRPKEQLFSISSNTLSMMDTCMNNYDLGKVSEPIDLSSFEDIE